MAIDQEYYFALPRRELVHRTRIRSSQEVLKSHFCNDKRLSLYKRGSAPATLARTAASWFMPIRQCTHLELIGTDLSPSIGLWTCW